MRTLIVEDDAFKAKQIESEVRDTLPGGEVFHASSLQQAVEALGGHRYEFVILDMAIPSHSEEGGSADVYSQPIGGLDVLLYLALDNRDEKVIILTQYPTVEYNRQHTPLAKLKSRLELDGISNLSEISLFGEDGKWKARLRDFLESGQ
ncbi:MAG TPA: response regulator [Sphingomonas sp.]|nr:response regulator [Sphingomonas sp.]